MHRNLVRIHAPYLHVHQLTASFQPDSPRHTLLRVISMVTRSISSCSHSSNKVRLSYAGLYATSIDAGFVGVLEEAEASKGTVTLGELLTTAELSSSPAPSYSNPVLVVTSTEDL